jgi:hypothetical protein
LPGDCYRLPVVQCLAEADILRVRNNRNNGRQSSSNIRQRGNPLGNLVAIRHATEPRDCEVPHVRAGQKLIDVGDAIPIDNGRDLQFFSGWPTARSLPITSAEGPVPSWPDFTAPSVLSPNACCASHAAPCLALDQSRKGAALGCRAYKDRPRRKPNSRDRARSRVQTTGHYRWSMRFMRVRNQSTRGTPK